MKWLAWLLILGTLSSALGQGLAPISASERLRHAVTQALLLDPYLTEYPLTVIVGSHSGVTLNGVLPTNDDRTQAERVAKAVPNVGKVTDHIMVDPAASPLGDATAADPARLANLQFRIQHALDADLALSGVTARTYPRLVTLTGIVATGADKARAGKLAQESAGGMKVANAIAVAPTSAGAIPPTEQATHATPAKPAPKPANA